MGVWNWVSFKGTLSEVVKKGYLVIFDFICLSSFVACNMSTWMDDSAHHIEVNMWEFNAGVEEEFIDFWYTCHKQICINWRKLQIQCM